MSELSRRYVVLTEGREDIPGFIVLPGSVRMPHDTDIIPVTLNYKHDRVIGAATDFQRAGVIDGMSKITMAVRFSDASGLTHDDVAKLKAGVYINHIFAYNPFEVIFKGKYITDGIIQEVSFYDPKPPAYMVGD